MRLSLSNLALHVFSLISATALLGCSSLREDFVKNPSNALVPAGDTSSSRYVAGELGKHDGLSGFRLLTRSTNALMSRVALTDQARHSIDMQYYIFKNDATGRLLAQRLLAAADRGVRVRILLDDMNLGDEDRLFDALDAHENIEVRLFNPFHTRDPSTFSKIRQFLFDGRRLNRRMHNKSFIADSTVAIIGGRNIGDDYFDAGAETNFRDLDLIAIGPVVREASNIFDDYWNSDAAYPVTAFHNRRDAQADLGRLRIALTRDARSFAQSDYAQATLDELPEGATGDRRGEWFWGDASVIADQPEKIDGRTDDPALRIGPRLRIMIDGAHHTVDIMSPYFIPGDAGTIFLSGLVQRGVNIRIITNSLASTDEPAAHSGYAHYRRKLLEAAVELYELRPTPGAAQPATSRGASSGISLHAKAVVVDGEYVFIGSLNMDQRSKLLNTEMGVVVESLPLAKAVEAFFDTASSASNSFHVILQQSAGERPYAGKMSWLWSEGGIEKSAYRDPGVTGRRRFEVFVLKLLPIEGLL